MENFINVRKKDPEIQIKIKDILDKNNKLHYIYQSKKGYDTLIQNVILKELINIIGTAITDIDIELKMKIKRTK